MARLSIEDLKSIRLPANVIYCFKLGADIQRRAGILKPRDKNHLNLTILESGRPAGGFPWSLITNKPTGKSQGYLGVAWLEITEE